MSDMYDPQGAAPVRTHYHPIPKGVGFLVRKICNIRVSLCDLEYLSEHCSHKKTAIS